VLTVLIGLTACQKAELKKPVEVNFSLKMEQDNSGQGLKMSWGELCLTKFDVIGDRAVGDDISFIRSFENGLISDLNGSGEVAELDYDLPQGEYKSVEIWAECQSLNVAHSLILTGKYVDGPSTFNVRFETTESIDFSILGCNEDQVGSILFDKSMAKKVTVGFDVDYWFEEIDEDMWEDADRIVEGNQVVILINESSNLEIYQSVITRIPENVKAIFKN
jgi:hypothetical protein